MAQQGGVHGASGGTQTLQEVTPLAAPPPAPLAQREAVTLVLRPRKKVSWNAETVDNEHMQKKSSKICCVYHKKESLEDSSDEEDGHGGKGKGKRPCPHHTGEVGESSKRPGE